MQHLASGGKLDLALLQGLIGHAWSHEPNKQRYGEAADREDAAYQVGSGMRWWLGRDGLADQQCGDLP